MIQVTYAGWLSGLDAMNSAGLVNGHNSVGSRFNKSGERKECLRVACGPPCTCAYRDLDA